MSEQASTYARSEEHIAALEAHIHNLQEELRKVAESSKKIVENALTAENVAHQLRAKLAAVYPLVTAADQFIQGLEAGMDVTVLRETYYRNKVAFNGRTE